MSYNCDMLSQNMKSFFVAVVEKLYFQLMKKKKKNFDVFPEECVKQLLERRKQLGLLHYNLKKKKKTEKTF